MVDGGIMCVERSMWGGAGVILLICESCQRPLEDESLSGRVMYSENVHTEGGSDFSSRGGNGWGSDREHLYPEIS